MDRPRAILYARVSTEEQIKGFSLRQQLSSLKNYAVREGYEVLAEEGDEGWSGSELVRPALDRMRDLVAAGGVSIVLAQDADRITREPSHRALLDEECERHGCKLAALDDWDDDSEEGQLLKYIRGWVSRQERLKFMERSRRGTFQKVREGKVPGSGVAKYGFAFVLDDEGKRVGLRVEEEALGAVRRIFRMLAEGESVNCVRKTLDEASVPTPAGSALGWSRAQIRNIVWDDAYRPHTAEPRCGPEALRPPAAPRTPCRAPRPGVAGAGSPDLPGPRTSYGESGTRPDPRRAGCILCRRARTLSAPHPSPR
jgi:site-specific DNA recombinase